MVIFINKRWVMKFLLMYLVVWLIIMVFQAAMYYAAAKIVRCDAPFKTMVFIALITSLMMLVPGIGVLLSILMLLYLLKRLGNMDIYPKAILITLIGTILSTLVLWGLQKIMIMIVQAAQ